DGLPDLVRFQSPSQAGSFHDCSTSSATPLLFDSVDAEDMGPGLDERYLEEIRERVRTSPFHQWAGITLLGVGGGESEVAMALGDHHFNPQGIVHGGVIAAIADTSIGLALRSIL